MIQRTISGLLILINLYFGLSHGSKTLRKPSSEYLKMMTLALKAGNYKFALIEIPFLLIPLVLIYLGHPFNNGFKI